MLRPVSRGRQRDTARRRGLSFSILMCPWQMARLQQCRAARGFPPPVPLLVSLVIPFSIKVFFSSTLAGEWWEWGWRSSKSLLP